jgi:hypothetical protein
MIVELGHFALILALMVALVQATLPLWGAQRGDARLMALAGPAAGVQLVLIGASFAALTWAFVVSDFSLAVVVSNSHTLKPMLYKVSGCLGEPRGIAAAVGADPGDLRRGGGGFGGNLPARLKARVLAVQAMIGVAFMAFLLFTSNPFWRLASRRWTGGPEPAVAGPRFGLPSAVPVSGLCRAFHGVQLCRGRADRGPGRCGLGALGAALDAGGLGLPDHRHRAGVVVGLLRTWLGRVLVLGPGGKRQLHALASGGGAAAFGHRGGKARKPEGLDDPSWRSWPSASA